MASYKVPVTSNEDLQQEWKDNRCPNFCFCFDQQDLEDCVIEDGEYMATYQSMEVTEKTVYTYIGEKGQEIDYTLDPGEYGIKP